MKINHEDFNWHGFDIEYAKNMIEGDDITYLGTFCIKGNYKPCAVFHSPNPNLEKGHKPYPYLTVDGSQMFIGGMEEDEFEKERYQYGLYCNHCESIIYSVNRHDYHTCSCKDENKQVSIDGGRDYIRTAFGDNADYENVKIDFKTGEIK